MKFNVVRIEEAKLFCEDGLNTDGAHHKQWYLEQIYEALGGNLSDFKKYLYENDFVEPAEGIAQYLYENDFVEPAEGIAP